MRGNPVKHKSTIQKYKIEESKTGSIKTGSIEIIWFKV